MQDSGESEVDERISWAFRQTVHDSFAYVFGLAEEGQRDRGMVPGLLNGPQLKEWL